MNGDGIGPVTLDEPHRGVDGRHRLPHAVVRLRTEHLPTAFASVPSHAIDTQRIGWILRVNEKIDVSADRNTRKRRIAFNLTIISRVG